MVRSDLPFGSEFSPSQIDLPCLLDIVHENTGDWHDLEEAIRQKWFETHNTSDYNRGKLANNCKLGMIAYGIIDRDGNLTPFGVHLWEVRKDETCLYDDLAKHILINLKGLEVIKTVDDMRQHGQKITLVSLRKWLGERGINFPRGGKHPSIMRLWLEKARVITSKDWETNFDKIEELIGLGAVEIEELMALTLQQKTFLRTLALLGSDGPFFSNDIEKQARSIYGVEFDEKNLPKRVLYPLRDAGYIELERGTKKRGRGAKPFEVRPTDKLKVDVIRPLLDNLETIVQDDLRPLLRKTMTEILTEVNSTDKFKKGLALEALAFHLMRLLDLEYRATRLRGKDTGGAEVDLVFEGARLIFSRWQVQCKNTKQSTLEDVAKEVGLTFHLKSNVIMVVTTGKFSKDAIQYATSVMQTTNLNIILLNKEDLQKIKDNPTYISVALNRQARRAMKIKQMEMDN